MQGDGSSLKKARKFGQQFRNDFPDMLKKWPERQTADGLAWRVPAGKIIANGYNLTLASLGLVEPEKTDHAQPEEILSSVAEKERKILEIVKETQRLVMDKAITVNYQQLLNESPVDEEGEALAKAWRVISGILDGFSLLTEDQVPEVCQSFPYRAASKILP